MFGGTTRLSNQRQLRRIVVKLTAPQADTRRAVQRSATPRVLSDVRRENAQTLLLFLSAGIAFVMRIVISSQILNKVVDYTSEGGSFLVKLHVGTYAVLMVLFVVLFSRPIRLQGSEIPKFRTIVRFSAVLICLTAYLFAAGRSGSSGFLLDSYLTGAAAGLIVLALGRDSRRLLGELVLWLLVASAAIGIIEALLEIRLLPYDKVEESFRPIGLTSHPLALGALSATAVGFVILTRWRLWIRIAVILILLLGCAASSARLALLISGFECLALLLLVPWSRLTPAVERRAKFAALIIVLVLGTVLIAALFAAGLLNRFRDSLFDESFMARITIYQVFNYVNWRQILFGMDVNDLTALVNEKLKIKFIESTPVFLILVFGAFAAAIFAISFFWMLRRLLTDTRRPALIATVTYLVLSLSNNALSTKTPEILILTVLLLAFAGPSTGETPAQGAGRAEASVVP
jgi:hypothetical protein